MSNDPPPPPPPRKKPFVDPDPTRPIKIPPKKNTPPPKRR